MKLIQEEDMWDREVERLFVEAFWETLAALYRQEADAVSRGGSRSATDRMEDMNEAVRRDLMRAKTRSLLRQSLTEFFSKPIKSFRSSTLTGHAAALWRLLDDDWKKGRDLALLALASYQSKAKRDASKPG